MFAEQSAGGKITMNLRKGHSSVYLQYPTVGESMGAEMFEVVVRDDVLIFRFKVKPVDSNQKSDEDHLHEMELSSVTVDDDYIINKFTDFIQSKTISAFHLEITSRGKCLVFNIAEGPGRINGLTLNIERKIC
ncbi:hypothetical protein HQ524_04245 [Candidatus Uhrbacteria bacterium]|nr:hypothetical protein [Candidatus Uhrbacteria bacterium]